MISIISATNRKSSMTVMIANIYKEMLEADGIEAQVFSLENIPDALLNDSMYKRDPHQLRDFGTQIFNAADEIILISPEYNGSFPGILKLVIDSCIPSIFDGKKFALVGVASGRAGNLRGMDHLTDILHYLKAEVYSQKLPISQIKGLMNGGLSLSDENSLNALMNHKNGFLKYLGRKVENEKV